MNRRILTYFIVLIVIVIVGFFIVHAYWHSVSSSITSNTGTSSIPADCGGCVGLQDNGKHLALGETSRITIILPEAGYDKNSVTITPQSTFGETFGASSAPGDWVRTFEAVAPGDATITIPALNASYRPFVITATITGPDSTQASKNIIITQDDNNKTLSANIGDQFLLKLGNMDWTVSLGDQSSIEPIKNIAVIQGAQGIYVAKKSGTTVLTAEGRPHCEPGTMCAQYIVFFKVTITVQ